MRHKFRVPIRGTLNTKIAQSDTYGRCTCGCGGHHPEVDDHPNDLFNPTDNNSNPPGHSWNQRGCPDCLYSLLKKVSSTYTHIHTYIRFWHYDDLCPAGSGRENALTQSVFELENVFFLNGSEFCTHKTYTNPRKVINELGLSWINLESS